MSSVQYLGPYRLLTLLRTGASCQVWEAIPSAGGERVAVKSLMSQFLKDKEARAALKKEYDIGKDFDHPRVIHLLNYGASRDDCFVALELFKAPNMKQMLQQMVQSADEEANEELRLAFPRVVEEAAEGVAYIHSVGVLHRDLKPHNFLVAPDGETKLIDFSLASKPAGFMAKLLGGRSKVQGTRSYMAPEQIRGRALDERTDIYSYGCTIFELFHGKPPFTGATANDLLQRHLRSPAPSLSASNRNVTPEFSELVQRCMAKKPEGRPQAMEDLLKELRAIKVYKPEYEFARR